MRITAAVLITVLLTGSLRAVEVTDEQVEQTIGAMKAYLYSRQSAEGSWEVGSGHSGGGTALVTLSLMLAGDSPQSPQLSRAIRWLEQLDLSNGSVYSLSLRTHVWAQMPGEYLPRLSADAAHLLGIAEAHPDKLFRYTRTSAGAADLSCGQYGMLGLWEAAKRGVPVSRLVWKRYADELLRQQNDDGGWGYSHWRQGSSGTMTCAGLTILYMVQEELHRHYRTPDRQVALAIERGLKWMDKHFDAERNPGLTWGGWEYYYYLYGVERVALAGGIHRFKEVDWYHTIADRIVRQARETGRVPATGNISAEINTAFALMFLARGRYPVMIRKLAIPTKRCNDRPMDLTFFARYLSDSREAEMNWQVVDVGSDPYEWISSPILYLSSGEDIALTDEYKGNLKIYIDLGGTLVCTPDNSSPQFLRSVRQIAGELYPDHPLAPLRSDDPIFESHDPNRRHNLPDVEVVSNGARNLIYIATSDWGYEFQAGKSIGRSAPWTIMSSIWASATNRGRLPGRLTKPIEPRMHRDTTGRVAVQRLRYPGGWDPEPRAWEMSSNMIWNRTGVEVRTHTVDMTLLAASKTPLAHLAGADRVEFTADQLDAVEQYLRSGGTLLIETVGGLGEFSRGAARQVAERLGAAEGPLPPSHPILTGDGLPGGHDNTRTFYRRYAALRLGLTQPVLSALYLDGRAAVLITHHDLSVGALGARHWHVIGYDTDSARRLLTNIVLWAQQARPAEPGAAE